MTNCHIAKLAKTVREYQIRKANWLSKGLKLPADTLVMVTYYPIFAGCNTCEILGPDNEYYTVPKAIFDANTQKSLENEVRNCNFKIGNW